MAVTLPEVKSFIESNKDSSEVQGFVNSFITGDKVNSFLNTDDGKKLIQPMLDQYHAKGIEGWKQKNLQKHIDEAIAKMNPGETEEQKRLKKIESDNAALQRQILRGQLKDNLLKAATKDGLPISLIDFAIGDDEESTNARYDSLKEAWKKALDEQAKAIFKNNGRSPIPGSDDKKLGGMNSFIRGAAGVR